VADGFDYQPSLSSAVLELRPLRADDFGGLYAAAADPGIWDQHPVKDRYREEVFRPYFESLLDAREALVVIDPATGRIIGMSRFHGHDSERSEVEVGWTFLARAYWGGRYNRELKRLMLGHAFQFVGSVIFLVAPENVRSQRSVEKLGGRRCGTRPDAAGRESIAYEIGPEGLAALSRREWETG
jgi:RimJ/RimL family protein N-acetyltransferase